MLKYIATVFVTIIGFISSFAILMISFIESGDFELIGCILVLSIQISIIAVYFILKIIQKFIIYLRSKKYKNKSLKIMLSNCIGEIIYHDYCMKFNSLTIKMYFENNDFIKF